MITKFNKFINEGVFSSKYDKYVKDFFEEIKKEFDYDNLSVSGHNDLHSFLYDHDGIELKITKNGIRLYIEIDRESVKCSKLLKLMIYGFFSEKFKKKNKMVNKEKTDEFKNKLKDKLDPVNRKADKYNI